jgi:hypothetical protein
MTASATESALLALKAALDASTALPDVRRDPVFDDIFEELAVGPHKFGRVLAMRAGDNVETTRRFGTGSNAFEHVREAEIEWFVAGAEGASLNSTFDDGINAIFSAIEADPTLGGAVELAEIVAPPELGTDQAGARAVLTALIRVQLTFLSARAY